jgi:hypothetical protein
MALVRLPNGHYALNNNEVYWFPLTDEDAQGNIVPAPAGDTVSAVGGGPFAASLAFAVGVMPAGSPDAGAPAVSATPMVAESDAGNSGGGISVVLTDTAGLAEDSATKGLMFDIVKPPPGPAATEGINIAGVFMVSQPTPAPTGP